MKLCDLHTHTVFSDGTDTPAQLVEKAQQAGLSAVALTDHNTVAGLPEFLRAAEGKPLQAVPGIEFSTDWEGTELHILGLWIRPQHYAAITDRMQEQLRQKELSNVALVERLAKVGYAVDYEKIRATTHDGYVNRAHIAVELTAKGYTQSVQDAFQRLLGVKAGFYVPPKMLQSLDVLAFIREMGAVSVLAHPFLNLDEAGVRRFLPQAVDAGLCGMEVLYGMYDDATTALSMELARAHGVRFSGGSDYHGGNKPHIQLGKGRGSLVIPMDYCAGLEEMARNL